MTAKENCKIEIVGTKMRKTTEFIFDRISIEKMISGIHYNGQGLIRDEKVENAQLPSIAFEFYDTIFSKMLPTPSSLLKKYIMKHFEVLDNMEVVLKDSGKIFNRNAIAARVFRTYPSLLRDFHFYILCNDSGRFDSVRYSTEDDFANGVDLRIGYKGKDFALSLFVETNRGQSFKNVKYDRHNYNNINEICVGINPFDKKNYIGEFALYNDRHIEFIIAEMEKMLIKISNEVCA